MTPEGQGPSAQCLPTGTTGDWNAATGSSDGWEAWKLDLSPFAGGEVEISISYVTSSATFPGVLIDDVETSTGYATSFENGLDGWEVAGAPEGSPPNDTDFSLATSADYPYSAVIVTDDTIFFGFGAEGIADVDKRSEVLGRAVDYLLRDVESPTVYLPAAYASAPVR
jgi:hypothetical protein